jgi:hypothetical protein
VSVSSLLLTQINFSPFFLRIASAPVEVVVAAKVRPECAVDSVGDGGCNPEEAAGDPDSDLDDDSVPNLETVVEGLEASLNNRPTRTFPISQTNSDDDMNMAAAINYLEVIPPLDQSPGETHLSEVRASSAVSNSDSVEHVKGETVTIISSLRPTRTVEVPDVTAAQLSRLVVGEQGEDLASGLYLEDAGEGFIEDSYCGYNLKQGITAELPSLGLVSLGPESTVGLVSGKDK